MKLPSPGSALSVSAWIAILLSGCALHVPERIVSYPDEPPGNDLSVELVLSEEFRNAKWEPQSGGAGRTVMLGDNLTVNATSLAERLFGEVIVTGEATDTTPNPTLLPRIRFISRTMPATGFGTQETAIALEWTLKDAQGNLVWVDTVTGIGRGGLDSVDEQLHPLIDDLFLKSFQEISSSFEVTRLAASASRGPR